MSDEAGEAFARLSLEFHGVAPGPTTSDSADVKWWNRPDDGLMTGTLFSAGSGDCPRWSGLRRARWAVVQVDAFGNAAAVAYGPLSQDLCPMQAARDGEDYAIAMLAQTFKVYIDY